MKRLAKLNSTLISSATSVFLIVVSAAVVLAACSDPAPASSPTPVDTPALVNESTAAFVPSPTAQAAVAQQWPPAPRPTATPGAMLVLPTPEPSALGDEAYAVLDTLTTQYSPRESMTDQEMKAALYLQGNFHELGYETSLQEFHTSQIFIPDLHLTSGEGEPIMNTEESHLHPVPVLLPGDVSATGVLTYVGAAREEDIPDDGLGGRIPLIDIGTTTFREQVDRVAEAGAPGAIVTNADVFELLIPYGYRPAIPVFWIGPSDVRAVTLLIEKGERVSATIDSNYRDAAESQNVVADLRNGANDPQRQVILGAHYDTVEDTQGASDNGSGVSALMTVARHIAERDYPFDIRIILFGAEEFGLFGSEHYVNNMSQEEIDSTIIMLNFDALGSGNTLHAIGDLDLASKAIEIGRELGAPIALEGTREASSDHAPFAEVGIPVLFLSSNDITRINAPEDTIEYINPDLLGYAAEIAIAMLDHMADEPR